MLCLYANKLQIIKTYVKINCFKFIPPPMGLVSKGEQRTVMPYLTLNLLVPELFFLF